MNIKINEYLNNIKLNINNNFQIFNSIFTS